MKKHIYTCKHTHTHIPLCVCSHVKILDDVSTYVAPKSLKAPARKAKQKTISEFRFVVLCVCMCVWVCAFFSSSRALFALHLWTWNSNVFNNLFNTQAVQQFSSIEVSFLSHRQHLLLPLLLLALGVFIFYFISFFVPSKQIVFLFVWIFSICVWLFFNCICKKLKSTKKHVGAFCGNILSEIVLNFYFIFCYSESGWLHSIVEKNRIVTCNRKYGKSRSDCYLQRTFQCSPNFIYGTVPIATVK